MPLLLRSEEMILLAVWKLQPDAYGVTIRRYLNEVTGQSWSMASVYVPLDRLADRGYIQALHGAPTKERGGRRKRYFRLTRKGVAALSELHAVQRAMWDGFIEWTQSA